MYKDYELSVNFATQEVEYLKPEIRRIELVQEDTVKLTFTMWYGSKRVIISGTTIPTGKNLAETDFSMTSPTYAITVKYPTGSTTTLTPTKVTGEEKLEVTFEATSIFVGTNECELIISDGTDQVASCKFQFYVRELIGASSTISTNAFEFDTNLDLMPVIATAINDLYWEFDVNLDLMPKV